MPLAIRHRRQCAFCMFRSSEWLTPSIWQPVPPQNGVRQYSSFPVRRLYPSKHTPSARNSPQLRRLPRDRTNVPIRRTPNPAAYRPFSPMETTYSVFGRLLLEQKASLRRTLKSTLRAQTVAWGITSNDDLEAKLSLFQAKIESCVRDAENGVISKEDNPLFHRLRRAFVLGGVKELAAEMKYAFINNVVSAVFNSQDKTNQERLADLRDPLDWFPATRALQRTVHLHVGPTNSGKTYHALQKLEAAKTGVYAGPLRLLAHEVYSRFNAKGKLCALITGEERRVPEGLTHQMSSCTVEMVPLNASLDVAVIDEIQMMGDSERGWAWTQAFLGVQAKEVHLCGELRTIDLVKALCKSMGDKLVIHKYERLSPLEMETKSLCGDLRHLQKGDAIILFSRVAIHAMKADVERITGKRCAVVYGSLPPETRAQQAALFNDPNNDYDFLVASDAVGMGLNLSIKRIIFEATSKHDGTSFRVIRTSEIKQIAGRAGRYKTAGEAVKEGSSTDAGGSPLELDLVKKPIETKGFVTTLEDFDLPVVEKAMKSEVEPLKTAGIFPPSNILLRFANYFPPNTPFSYIILRLHEISTLNPRFHMCRLKEQIEVVDLIQPYKLSVMDRIIFMSAPVTIREYGFAEVITEFAECVEKQTGGELLDLKSLDLELLEMGIHQHPFGTKGYLKAAEALHKALTLYLWLSYRFAGIFRSQGLAFHVKSLVEEKIDECLAEVHWDANKRRQLNKLRQRAAAEQAIEMDIADLVGDDPDSVERHVAREEDGSDADETFEIEAAKMRPGEVRASHEDSSKANITIPPPTAGPKHDTASV